MYIIKVSLHRAAVRLKEGEKKPYRLFLMVPNAEKMLAVTIINGEKKVNWKRLEATIYPKL